jgi:hypothetical protein
VSFFKDNAMEVLLNNHVNVKNAPIGGTSAGMAILGKYYFSSQNGSVTSAAALNNPYNANMTIGGWNPIFPFHDFLDIPFLGNTITDTHYDNPNRKGRHTAFLARIMEDYTPTAYGIACNEYTAVCIGSNGIAHVYGDYPNYDEFAYFIQPNCLWTNTIENCQSGQPLTWNFNGEALKVYKVPGTMNGTHYFDLNNWGSWTATNNSGGSWEHWSVNNGVFNAIPGTPLSQSCALAIDDDEFNKIKAYPNPFFNYFSLENSENATVEIFNSLGQRIFTDKNFTSEKIITADYSSGLYIVKIQKDGKIITKKIVKN